MTSDPLAIAQALLRCPSVTPAEGGALAYVEGVLRQAGFAVHRPVFSEPGQPDVENLFARIGAGAPCLVFAGHTDVVPPGDPARWRHDPFGGVVDGERIYGRGATDMKGGIACMLAATLSHLEAHGPDLPGSIAFLLTGDEEGPAVNGTVKLLAWAKARGEPLDHCVLGEPTNPERLGDMMKIGRRGSLTGRVVVEGRQGHVAYPQLARNPIPILARIVEALARPLDGGTARFDASNLEWTSLDVGNPATNVIPAEARGVFNVRFNDLWTPDSLATEVQARLRALGEPGCRVTFDPTNSVAFLTEPDAFVALVGDAVREETGLQPALSTSGGTSDARFIQAYCPVIEFGLVGKTMHAVDEHVAVEDLRRLTRVYGRIIARYFEQAQAGSLPAARPKS